MYVCPATYTIYHMAYHVSVCFWVIEVDILIMPLSKCEGLLIR